LRVVMVIQLMSVMMCKCDMLRECGVDTPFLYAFGYFL